MGGRHVAILDLPVAGSSHKKCKYGGNILFSLHSVIIVASVTSM